MLSSTHGIISRANSTTTRHGAILLFATFIIKTSHNILKINRKHCGPMEEPIIGRLEHPLKIGVWRLKSPPSDSQFTVKNTRFGSRLQDDRGASRSVARSQQLTSLLDQYALHAVSQTFSAWINQNWSRLFVIAAYETIVRSGRYTPLHSFLRD